MKKIECSLTEPKGFSACGLKAGLKKSGKHDLGLLLCEAPCAVGAVFTQNKAAAAPVLLSREHASAPYVQALVVNSGCANACTGVQGKKDALEMAEYTAGCLGIPSQAVLVCSTGIIGQNLPMKPLKAGIQKAASSLSKEGGDDFPLAIQTTDTFQKKSACSLVLGGEKAIVSGIAKGAGMIHPNMATMLAFITTDAAVSPSLLKSLAKDVADLSFNMVVVDGDTSTNDSFIILASGMAGNEEISSSSHPDYAAFKQALLEVAQDLARQIARDGEGATKFLEVLVEGAASFTEAKAAAMAIAKSPLVKTAFYGGDANWGRIICAAGYSGAEFSMDKVHLSLGGICIMKEGVGIAYDEKNLSEIMAAHDIFLKLSLGQGEAEAAVWTCDLTNEYVNFNGKYTT